MGNWEKMEGGRLDSAVKRLLSALGNDATRVLHLINLDPSFAARIARYATSQIGPDGQLIRIECPKPFAPAEFSGTGLTKAEQNECPAPIEFDFYLDMTVRRDELIIISEEKPKRYKAFRHIKCEAGTSLTLCMKYDDHQTKQ